MIYREKQKEGIRERIIGRRKEKTVKIEAYSTLDEDRDTIKRENYLLQRNRKQSSSKRKTGRVEKKTLACIQKGKETTKQLGRRSGGRGDFERPLGRRRRTKGWGGPRKRESTEDLKRGEKKRGR